MYDSLVARVHNLMQNTQGIQKVVIKKRDWMKKV